MPHWLVINDQRRIDEAEWQTLTRRDGVAGVTFVRLAPEEGCRAGVRIHLLRQSRVNQRQQWPFRGPGPDQRADGTHDRPADG